MTAPGQIRQLAADHRQRAWELRRAGHDQTAQYAEQVVCQLEQLAEEIEEGER